MIRYFVRHKPSDEQIKAAVELGLKRSKESTVDYSDFVDMITLNDDPEFQEIVDELRED